MSNLWRYPLYALIYLVALCKARGSHQDAMDRIERAMIEAGL